MHGVLLPLSGALYFESIDFVLSIFDIDQLSEQGGEKNDGNR